MNMIEECARPEIKGFFGEYRFLSNFQYVNCTLPDDDILYPSTEHAYQAAKTMNMNHRRAIAGLASCGDARRAGQNVEYRPGWESIKLRVMYDLNMQKYSVPELRAKLLATGDAFLEETNTWGDTYWGVCKGKGQNKLGIILMVIRANIIL